MSKFIRALKELYDLLAGKASKDFEGKLRDTTLDDDARRTVMLTARGNVALTAGYYLTAQALEREREEIRQIDFVMFGKKHRLLPSWMLFPVEQRALHKLARAITAKWRNRGRGRQ